MKRSLPVLVCLLMSTVAFNQTVTFTINTNAARKPISPYIYGINHTTDFPIYNSAENYGSFRLGGNRLTGYNWETNASNAGEDYINNSDAYLCSQFSLSTAQCNMPGSVMTKFRQQSGTKYALTTLPLAGYVAADKAGPVSQSETAPSARWKAIQHQKGSALSLTPNTTDGFVYSDEAVNYFVATLGNASNGGIQAYNLDNEPGLWSGVTHPRLHPAQAGAVELVTKSSSLAKAIKSVDVNAEVIGGVFYGFSDCYNLQSALDWSSVQASYSWYVDYFLDKLRLESAASNKRLLDVLDLHWYPEAVGDRRIIDNNANSAADRQARMQAPRTLWDANYRENSWIAQYFSSYLPLLGRIKSSINQYYPGTKIDLSEYNYGGGGDISGGIAQADVLGILGKYDVYSAQLWPLNTSVAYFQTAFRMFRNYNGLGRSFGDMHVQSSTTDSVLTSVYASIDGNSDSTLHLILINKSSASINGNISLSTSYNTLEAWRLDGNSSNITNIPQSTINNNAFSYTLAPLSVYHLVLRRSVVLPVKLKMFDGNLEGATSILQWQTASESNASMFELLRSCGNMPPVVIKSIPANNNSSGGSIYTYRDALPSECKDAVVTYQLRMIDAAGTVQLSKVIKLSANGTSPALELYPNPAGEKITISGLFENAVEVIIRNGQGQAVKRMPVKGVRQVTISITNLPKGLYWIEVQKSDGFSNRIQFAKFY